jgi:hypothetical protein
MALRTLWCRTVYRWCVLGLWASSSIVRADAVETREAGIQGRLRVTDWIYESTERQTYWWACRICYSMGRDNPSRQRVEGLLVRHLREHHDYPEAAGD